MESRIVGAADVISVAALSVLQFARVHSEREMGGRMKAKVLRLLWRLAHPFCVAGHKVFGLSYKWVNVSRAAWHRELFDPLWHHRLFGDEIQAMPDDVNLCGIRYNVTVAEGLIQFVSRDLHSRLMFERDPHDRYGFLWYYQGHGHVPVCHVCRAYEWVEAVYGGSHDLKRPAVRPFVQAET